MGQSRLVRVSKTGKRPKRAYGALKAKEHAAFLGSGVTVVSAVSQPEERPSARADLAQLARRAARRFRQWFSTPNPNLGGRKPGDLVGTKDEQKVYNLLNAVDQGLF